MEEVEVVAVTAMTIDTATRIQDLTIHHREALHLLDQIPDRQDALPMAIIVRGLLLHIHITLEDHLHPLTVVAVEVQVEGILMIIVHIIVHRVILLIHIIEIVVLTHHILQEDIIRALLLHSLHPVTVDTTVERILLVHLHCNNNINPHPHNNSDPFIPRLLRLHPARLDI